MKLFLTISISMVAFYCSAQVQINDVATPLEPSAILEINSNDKGFLPPRVNNPSTDISNPAKGLIVFDISSNCLAVNIGTSTSSDFKCVGDQLNRTRPSNPTANKNTTNTTSP